MVFSKNDYKKTIPTAAGQVAIYDLQSLGAEVSRLPYSIRILLESALRNVDGFHVTEEDVRKILSWQPNAGTQAEIPFKPARVVLQDFTGVPAIVDLAAMRSAMDRLGKDYRDIDLQVPCDLVIDHSVIVDAFGTASALDTNIEREFDRNHQRYELLKWAQGAFKNLRVVPPGTGIVHQVNLEYLARGVFSGDVDGERVAWPDSLVGTDSHTTMINGLGVVGWGVGGIEAEAVMLGEPIYMLLPEVVGFKLTGTLQEGVTATDLVLTVTETLRAKGVVGKFVEFYGGGLSAMTLPDRATIANMAPEYGATMGYFPVDEQSMRYYRLTGRGDDRVDLIESYMKAQGLFFTPQTPEPQYSDHVELDLAGIEPSLAGPRRPQDRVAVKDLKESFRSALTLPVKDGGFGVSGEAAKKTTTVAGRDGGPVSHGVTVIAAITSCTNTSNPSVMIAAGLVARNAVEKGLAVPGHVKTSLAPGSKVVTKYYEASGLDAYLEKLGFYTVGYGCTTCIGNSGPLPEAVEKVVREEDLVASAVLSGNRNFEGRVHPLTRANYLASPPLVIAYALAGTVDINLHSDPLGKGADGADVFLKDIWPSRREVDDVIAASVGAGAFREKYGDVFQGNEKWNDVDVPASERYEWNKDNNYVQEPPYFVDMQPPAVLPIQGARVLVALGDSVTTDHISPAGSIAPASPAGEYLKTLGIQPSDFNSYGSRRGNHQVMLRGTFANVRLRNQLVPGTEGPWTRHFPGGKQMTIYDASLEYARSKTPLIVLAGKEYGSGSSRDWAAKGTVLLGVRAVIAESYERIHRSNLIGMGVLPLQFADGQSWSALGLTGEETFDVVGLEEPLTPRQTVQVIATGGDGTRTEFEARVRIDGAVEVEYYTNGGILQTVLRRLAGG
ncbi:MAG: aconitate hydratase AcnA [Candidatus Krumholzibacteriia bacterium]